MRSRRGSNANGVGGDRPSCDDRGRAAGAPRGTRRRVQRVGRRRRLGGLDVPRPARATNIELDPRVGGRLRIDICENGVPFHVVGTYLVVDRPRRLQFTWTCSTWVDPDLETVVTVTLEPHDGIDTLMTIHHALLPSDQVSNHQHGWTAIAGQLDNALRRRTAQLRSLGDN
jgi:uncharacterized protein YndB with AHSA1/START domain